MLAGEKSVELRSREYACAGKRDSSENLFVNAHLRHLEPHEHAFYEGDPQTHIYRINTGMMRLYRLLRDGRRQIIAFRLPGHLIGIGDYEETQFCNAEALTSVALQSLPLSSVRRRMQEEPGFGSELVHCLAMELGETRKQVASLNRRSALEKLATFILGFLTWTGEDTSVKLELHVGRDDIADYLGLTAETVSSDLCKTQVTRRDQSAPNANYYCPPHRKTDCRCRGTRSGWRQRQH